MSVATAVSKTEYTGNGATTVFSTGFIFHLNSDVVVKLKPNGGTETVQTEGAHYSLTGAGDPAGGTVVFSVAPPNLSTVTIERTVPFTQPVDFSVQGGFDPDTHEKQLDYCVMMAQQLNRRLAVVEAQGAAGSVVAGNGLTFSGSTLHVGAGQGILANADDMAADWGAAADLANVSKAAESAGVLNKVARIDHKHDTDTAAPTAQADAAAAAEGTASALMRSDAKIQVSTAAPVSIGVANAAGSANSLAKSDHVHAHGAQTDGSHHAVATTGGGGANGFMSLEDKTALDMLQNGTFKGTASTTNATPTDCGTFTVPTNRMITVEAHVVGRRDTGTQGAGYTLRATFRSDGASLTQISTTTVVAQHEDDAAWNAELYASGLEVRVRVTGAAAVNINWQSNGRVFFVS